MRGEPPATDSDPIGYNYSIKMHIIKASAFRNEVGETDSLVGILAVCLTPVQYQ